MAHINAEANLTAHSYTRLTPSRLSKKRENKRNYLIASDCTAPTIYTITLYREKDFHSQTKTSRSEGMLLASHRRPLPSAHDSPDDVSYGVLFIVTERSVSVACQSYTIRSLTLIYLFASCFAVTASIRLSWRSTCLALEAFARMPQRLLRLVRPKVLPHLRRRRESRPRLNLATQWIKVDIGDCYKIAERYWRQKKDRKRSEKLFLARD